MAGKFGLSKKTTLQHDVAKKAAVKVGSGPFTKKIGDNHRPMANGGGSAHSSPGGKGGHMGKGKK